MDPRASLIVHYGALSGKTLALLRLGRLGEVLQITREGRESAEENLARSWLLSYREASLRRLAFDFEGAHRLCESIREASAGYPECQAQTISHVAAGYMELDRREYHRAIEHFRLVHTPKVPTKFFLHWTWRMNAQLQLGNAWLLAGSLSHARTTADGFLKSALSTSDPHLQALAWELKTRVAIAENDLSAARDHIRQALAIVDKFEILIAAWQSYATAWQLYDHTNERQTAKNNREHAEACIRQIAESFEADEPLRATFLSAAPVRQVLRGDVKRGLSAAGLNAWSGALGAVG